jgi:hypothetical protein
MICEVRRRVGLSFLKIRGSGIQKLMGEYTDTQTGLRSPTLTLGKQVKRVNGNWPSWNFMCKNKSTSNVTYSQLRFYLETHFSIVLLSTLLSVAFVPKNLSRWKFIYFEFPVCVQYVRTIPYLTLSVLTVAEEYSEASSHECIALWKPVRKCGVLLRTRNSISQKSYVAMTARFPRQPVLL